MSSYQYFLGEKTLITILKILPLDKDSKERILDIIVDDLAMDFFILGSRYSDLSLADNDWELDIEGYFSDLYQSVLSTFAVWEEMSLRHGHISVVVGEEVEEVEDHPLHSLEDRHMILPFLLYS